MKYKSILYSYKKERPKNKILRLYIIMSVNKGDVINITSTILLDQVNIIKQLKDKLQINKDIFNRIKLTTNMREITDKIVGLFDASRKEVPIVEEMNKKIIENVNECDDLLNQINVLLTKGVEHLERIKRSEKNKRIENDMSKNTNVPSLQQLSLLELDKTKWEEKYPLNKYPVLHDIVNENVGKGGRSTPKGRRATRKGRRTIRKKNTKRRR